MTENKREIAILTFHNAINYGAILQAYALQTSLKKYANYQNVGFIDYRCEKIEKKNSPLFLENGFSIKSILKMTKNFRIKVIRRSKFKLFQKRYLNIIPFSSKNEKREFLKQENAIVVGSDQVWNLELTNNDETYFLEKFPFVKKYSYAASIGVNSIKKRQEDIFKQLENFDKLSVREDSAKDCISTLVNKDINVVPDPVLLLTRENWQEIAKPYKGIRPDGYILLFHFNASNKLLGFAQKKAKEYGCNVICIQGVGKKLKNTKTIRDASPEQFLWLIENAKCVVTNSFHGTMFSIIFEKEFYSETSVARSTRIVEVLEKYNLKSHILYDGEIMFPAISEDNSSERISKDRELGLGFLSKL